MSRLQVPLFDVEIGDEEKRAVQSVLDEGWLTMGRRTEELESELADLLRVRHVVAVGSGTAALHASLVALGVGPGDEVICPTLTFVATANAIRYVGARVVFCDSVSADDLNLDPDDVERRITERTRAVVAVHYAGYPADLPRLKALCDRHGLALVEDAAHAFVSTLEGRACGTWGACGCYSFFSNKNVTCGEGGAVATDDDETAGRLRLVRSHGMTTSTVDRHEGHAHTYDVVALGYNYRIDEMRSSLLRVQLSRLDGMLERREKLVRRYRSALAGLPVEIPGFGWDHRARPGDRIAHHVFPVLLPAGADRAEVMTAMRELGVQTSIHYPPVHCTSSFAGVHEGAALPQAEEAAARELTLPLFPSMTSSQHELVCDALSRALDSSCEGA